ncbi:MAG: hypothetical protein ABIY50_13805 [Ignavibacteria bacterium]
MIKQKTQKIIYFISFIFFLNITSCCIFKTDNPDIRIIGQNFPSVVSVNQTFSPTFTVGNYSDGECDAATTTQSIVTFRMINRGTGSVQVNNTYTLNALDGNATQVFNNITVTIGTAGTYDLTFTVDPNHTSGDINQNNNVITGTIIVQ